LEAVFTAPDGARITVPGFYYGEGRWMVRFRDEVIGVLSDDTDAMSDFRRRFPKSPPVESLPVAVWVRLHGGLAFYLTEHQAQEASLLGFYHRNFLEAVTAHCLVAGEDRRTRHQHLVDWFGKQAWFLAPVTDKAERAQGAITDPPNTRKASELPWHLYKTSGESDPERCEEAVWQPLAEALCDLWLVEAKVGILSRKANAASSCLFRSFARLRRPGSETASFHAVTYKLLRRSNGL